MNFVRFIGYTRLELDVMPSIRNCLQESQYNQYVHHTFLYEIDPEIRPRKYHINSFWEPLKNSLWCFNKKLYVDTSSGTPVGYPVIILGRLPEENQREGL